MLTLIERSSRVVERALDKDDIRVALTLLTKLGVLAANDGVQDAAAIAVEATTNELGSKNGDLSPSRRG